MSLKPFQVATVERAVAALTNHASSRRFLVADEVGLGKTRVAQGVIERLTAKAESGQLKVFYLCSSIAIAEQNRRAILECLPSEEARKEAKVDVNRLTLIPPARVSEKAPFLLYTLTTGTLPGTRRTGIGQERAFIWKLLCKAVPGLGRYTTLEQLLRLSIGPESWQQLLEKAEIAAEAVPDEMARALRQALAVRLDLTSAAHRSTLIQQCRKVLGDEEASRDLIHHMRMAAAQAALRMISPDLVILDEFQRFFEELPLERDEDADTDAQKILRLILDGDRVAEADRARRRAPAVLLLSATPYPSFSTLRGGGADHHRDLFRLLAFLARDRGHDVVQELRSDFRAYREQLETEHVGGGKAREFRDAIERQLTGYMTRTERPRKVGRPGDLKVQRVDAMVNPIDVRVFRHLRDSAHPEDKSFVTGYWSSIPFPLQAMDRTYKLRERARTESLGATSRLAAVTWDAVRSFDPIPLPHPRLRKLLDEVPPELLALPWLPPTRPWWPLGKPFETARARVGEIGCSKALVFSRFRAVPRALAVAASYTAEQHAYDLPARGIKGDMPFEYHLDPGARPRQGRRRRPKSSFVFSGSSREDTALRSLTMFLPLPALATLADPLPLALAAPAGSLQLEKVLGKLKKRIRSALGAPAGRRPPISVARWAIEFERRSADWQRTAAAIRESKARIDKEAGEDVEASKGMLREMEGVLAPAMREEGGPTDRELAELAHLALLAPGNVLYRAVSRVFGEPQDRRHEIQRIANVATVACGPLRRYLDLPEFHVLLQQNRKSHHPASVRQAVWDGNLESVLDEFLSLQRGLGTPVRPSDVPIKEADALGALKDALSVGAASLKMTSVDGATKPDFKIRCHAALAFGLGADVAAESTGEFRSDLVRKAFNSPFRPHLLATTSIGQEGLDFHAFCDHIIHWDLPHNPVDLEQRDGRIDRYAGLAQRKVLAREAGPVGGKLRASKVAGASPWAAVASAQKDENNGLSPWWVHPEARIQRTVYVAPFSRTGAELDRLLQSLSLYRMALGQVDQESLVGALQRRLDSVSSKSRKELIQWLDDVRINLAPRG